MLYEGKDERSEDLDQKIIKGTLSIIEGRGKKGGLDQKIKKGTLSIKGSTIKPIEKRKYCIKGSTIKPIEKHSYNNKRSTIEPKKKGTRYPGKGRANDCSPLICRLTSSRAGLIPKANDSASREHLGVMSANNWFDENAQCSICVRCNFDT